MLVRRAIALASVVMVMLGVVHADATFGTDAELTERPTESEFRITGTVRNLYPRAKTTMRVRLRNLERDALVVGRIRATVVGTTDAACSRGVVRVRPFRRPVALAPRGTARITMHVSMSRRATDACMGVRWPLRFSGAAVRR